jgi:hypothetical protein
MDDCRQMLLGLILAVMSTSVFAANIWCTGTVRRVLVSKSGLVEVMGSWRGDWTGICNVKQDWQGVDPQTCMTWFAQTEKSLTTAKQVTIEYTGVDVDCATLPTYSGSPGPAYVMLRND